ncbi:DUF6923 family protein [Demequina litorisediminis]|uniref:DUF6923 domain-containing protein n=1 Tax=Demequina litorisediminis TaxID=1849022 RepID=A0ABQ6IL58_9MICO|nr:hypothetical protein [Demequina litorisediminis]GMA37772.1 hypothetical protein GCM10025876_39760 [Demequina litorisediminis]GMA37829.1 hypothetical protein GCM10025876_40330 [Demequina litorisediminis]GMA37907.1 hypothetical protein GCM10025876_41110 [Demequina litorisediminis]
MQHSAPITRRHRSRLHRAAALALAAVITAAGLTSAATTPSRAADQVPWACTGEGWILQNGPTEAYALDLASGVASRVATSDEPSNLNAVGYNEADGLLWGALREASPVIASMGSNGVTKRYGTPIGIGSKYDGPAWVIGDVDDAQQLWMLGLVDEAYVVMVVDVDRTSPTFMHSLADVYDVPVPAGTFNISDWAYEPYTGLVWALVRMADGTTTAMSLDPSNIEQGLVARHENLAMTYGTYGAMYADGEGNVYGGQNATGEIWRVNVITGATTLVATGPTSSQNDGARCTVPLTTDFGDAPDSYGTTVAADGARHSITGYDPESFTADYTLGDLVDADGDDALPGIKADGDDIHGAADEDALTIPLEYPVDGSPLTIDFPVQVRGDEPATVAAWFDTNSSGSFINDSDRVTTTISHSGTVSLTLPAYTPPAGRTPQTPTYVCGSSRATLTILSPQARCWEARSRTTS